MSAWIDIGYQNYVRADDIVAIGEEGQERIYAMPAHGQFARATVLLCNGDRIAGYVSAKTILKRIKEAEAGDE